MSTEIRVATFNASLNRATEGALISDLSASDNTQARSIAEIIQKTDADIILINEFDYDADGQAAALFAQNYLSVGQNGAPAIEYGYVYAAPSNTGVLSGFDLDNDGVTSTGADLGGFGYAGDAQGFGQFPGQYGFVIYSKYPIDAGNIRTFQEFLWKDMPDNLLTDGQGEAPLNEFYSAEEIDALRLSSKNHVDVPVIVDGETVHVLAAHPTPPVFDGPEDRNGKRNHDEIRFWSDYVEGAEYIYDDAGQTGGLASGERFVILGDYNADPFDGDSVNGAINQLLDNDNIQGSATDAAITPEGPGGTEQAVAQGGDNATHVGSPAFDTGDFGFNGDDPANDNAPGNLRVDYVLPSQSGLAVLDGGVFWPASDDPDFALTSFPTSDHRLVYADLRITDQDRRTVGALNADDAMLGDDVIPDDVLIEGTRLGGLSGITYNPLTGKYLAVSDDRGAGADGTPRIYELDIDLSDGSLDAGDVSVTGVTFLTLADGATTLDAITPDPEGIALGQSGQIYISSERDLDGNPAIYTFGLDGVQIGALPVDDKFLPDAGATQGVRNNLGFESLTITPDQTTLWTATESALVQDGDAATLAVGSPARIVKYDVETGAAIAEYIYEVDPIANTPDPVDGFADSGLVELLAIDNQGTLLALERSFSTGAEDRGYTGKLYLVRTQGATNVIGEDSVPTGLDDGELEVNVDAVVQKELLLDLDDLGIVIDNIEGMTLGPVLADGRQSLIIVSDDNFDGFGEQDNQVIALALDLDTIPTITPVYETPDELRYPGPEPIVIAHRGASGDRPEHTLEAYQLAIDNGADFIEPDLVVTKDGHLIARHEPYLATVETDANGEVVLDAFGNPVVTFASTNVADLAEFADRLTTKDIIPGFQTVTGWFAEDFTLDEIKTLRAREDEPDLRPQSAAFDDQLQIPTLEEIIELVRDTGVGIYPETKDPTYLLHTGTFLDGTPINFDISQALIDILVAEDLTDPARVFIQSFEVENLLRLATEIMPDAGVELPLVQLMFNLPGFPTVDMAFNFSGAPEADPGIYDALGFVDASTTSELLRLPENLAALADTYAAGIGPTLALILNGDGSQTDLVANADAAGLLVHAYTHRDESTFGGMTAEETYQFFLDTGIDGLFTDNSDTGRAVTDATWGTGGVDPDDPAIWLSDTDPAESLVITAMKEGGLRVYDLTGQELSRLEPEGIRYNNVDIVYGFDLAGETVDIAVASDRMNDTLAVFRINGDGTLSEITSAAVPATIFGVDDGEATAYGLTTYRSVEDGKAYVFVTQADGASIAHLELTDAGDGVSFDTVRILDLPVPAGEDAEDYQSEGIVIDRETGIGYVGVEDELGLLSFDAEADGDGSFTTVVDIDSGYFTPDLEGVEIFYGADGTGLIVVSSQGDATFSVFDRVSHDYLGNFAIRGENGIDGVEESDGLAIFSGGLPGFENGLLVTQDGSNEAQVVFGDPDDGEIQNFNVNFKYSDLGDVLAHFGVEANSGWDPREMAAESTFTLELLHFTDQEAGVAAISDAPNLSAVLNALRAEDLGDDGVADNTLTLSSGDSFIPGLFYEASATAFGSAGIADIEIQNQLGVQAIALGNHEFDFGTATFAGLISGDAPGDILGSDFQGALYPYLSTTLDVSTDANLAPLETAGGQAPLTNVITSSTVIATGETGELIGVVGATTPTLDIISSPGDVTITPGDFDVNPTPEQLDALAAEIQAEVDALLAANPDMNKVILLAHMQQIAIEVELAGRLENVDIIVAGGSNTRLFDETDAVRPGDSIQGEYPILVDNAGGTQTAVVNTDGSYKYVGRLVIDFDEDGNIIPESYDADVSGAYATDDAGVAALGAEGLVDAEIQQIVDEIQAVIIETESNVFGVSDVFLNGNRSGADTATDPDGVRTQETNLGNLTADANLAIAQDSDETVLVSIKNGGGIRASVGQVIVPPGGTEAVRDVNEQVVDGDGNVIKPTGGISQNDIATSLAFNNGLTLLTLTKAELVAVLEHGVSGLPGVSGRFAQVSGVKFSYDPDLDAGDRIQSAGIFDDAGELIMELVRDGELVGDADVAIRIVTLSFLADGGDGYPFPTGEDANRVDLFEGEDETTRSGDADFADDGTEQDALAEYLLDNYLDTPFSEADTGRDLDERIQNLNFREDDIFADSGAEGVEFVFGEETNNGVQDRSSISNFNIAEDSIVLEGGNGVASIAQRATGVAIYLQGEKDVIYVLGDDITAEDINIVERDPAVAPVGAEIVGTDESDSLVGTAGDDTIRSLGGEYDRMTGGGGADEFVFGAETADGIQNRDAILDFEVGIDSIVFEQAVEFRSIEQRATGVAIYLEDGHDAIYVLGNDVTVEGLTIINGLDDIV